MLADFDLIQQVTVQPEAQGATQLIHVLLTDKNLPVSSSADVRHKKIKNNYYLVCYIF